jgi:hypothetical protein
MAVVMGPLWHGRPCVQVVLTLTAGGQPLPRNLLADTGAGALSVTLATLANLASSAKASRR